MANPPPPYDNITGISRAVMKDNSQVTLANYNGNARPGELVVNLETNPPALYVGNNVGQLTLITGGGGGGGLPLANGDSYFDIAVASGNVEIGVDDSYFWTFTTTGNLRIPSNIVADSTIRIDNRETGNTADIQLWAADDILIQARDRDAGSTSEGGDINIYAGDSAENSDTSAGDVQIFAGNGGAANVDYGGTGGFVTIRSGDGGPAIGNSGYSASSGGDLTIRAGDAGANGGNIDLGSGGGVVYIYGGTATGNNQAGGAIILTSGTGGPNSAGGNIEVVVPGGDTGPGGTWTFNNAGNLTLPTNGSIIVDGGDGVIGPVSDDLVISWDNEDLRLVSLNDSIIMQSDTAFRVQTNYDGANVLYASRWEFNQNEIVNISNNFGIVSEVGNLNLSGGRDGVNSGNTTISAVATGVAVRTWTFDNTGNLSLPPSGNIVGVTANNNGYLNWFGNSSGDGNGYTTMRLVPDDTRESADQYLIIDPTAPGHIHIRAGGTQDNSSADLFLGGENSYFRVTAGANADVTISANSHQFVYGEFGYGVMRFPLRLYAELPQSPLIISGQKAFITDANLAASGNFGANVSGGGSNVVPVWSDGINWYIG